MDNLINIATKREKKVESLNAHFDEANSDKFLKDEIKKLTLNKDYESLFKLKCRHTVLASLTFDQLMECLKYLKPADIYDYARVHKLSAFEMNRLSQILILMKDAHYIYQFMSLENAPIDMLLYGLIKTKNLKYLRLAIRSNLLANHNLSLLANEIKRIEDEINASHTADQKL